MSLKIDVHEETIKMALVRLEGSLDTNTYLLLERKVDQVLQGDVSVIVFDLQRVDYISSAGVRVILKAQKVLKKRNGKISLIHLQPQVKKTLDFINALPSLSALPTEELDFYLDRIQRETAEKNH
jgi:anti-sigma B factor antagonist